MTPNPMQRGVKTTSDAMVSNLKTLFFSMEEPILQVTWFMVHTEKLNSSLQKHFYFT